MSELKKDPMREALDAAAQKTAIKNQSIIEDPFKKGARIISAKQLDVDRFATYSSKTYGKLGFDPFKDNNKVYNANTHWSEDIGRATRGMFQLAGVGFQDTFGFGLTAEKDNWKDFDDVMKNYSSTRGGYTQFWSNTMLSSGYTVGILGAIAAEEIGLALTTGGLGNLSTAGLVGIQATRAFDRLGQLTKGSKVLEKIGSLGHVDEAAKFFSLKGLGQNALKLGKKLNPVSESMDFLSNVSKLDDLNAWQKLAVGAGSVARDARKIYMTHSESKLEAELAKNEFVNKKILEAKYNSPDGQLSDKDVENIRTAGQNVYNSTYTGNLGLIYATNAITFDNMFKSMRYSNKMFSIPGKFTTALGKDGVVVKAVKDFSIKSAYKTGKKAVTDFVSKEGIKNTGRYIKANYKVAGANLIKKGLSNSMEGVQELGQDVVSNSVQSYYGRNHAGKQIRGGMLNYLYEDVGNSLKGTMNQQGLETFGSGFFMGSIASPFGGAIGVLQKQLVGGGAKAKMQYLFDRENYVKKQKTKYKESLAKAQQLTEVFNAQLGAYLDHTSSPLVQQAELQEEILGAAQDGNKKKFEDKKHDSLQKGIKTMLKNNSEGMFTDFLEQMVEKYTPEQMNQAMGRTDITENNIAEYKTKLQNKVETVKSLRRVYDDINEKIVDPVRQSDIDRLDESDPEQRKQKLELIIYKKAIANLKDELLFNNGKITNKAQRMLALEKQLNKETGLSSTEVQAFISKEGLTNEIQILQTQVEANKSLKLTGQEAENAKLAEQKLEKLTNYQKALTAIDKLESSEEPSMDEVEDAYSDLFEAYHEYRSLDPMHGFMEPEEVKRAISRKSFDAIVDYLDLSNESQALQGVVNTLLDPTSAKMWIDRNAEMLTDLDKNKEKHIANQLFAFQQKAESSEMLTELQEWGVFFDLDELDDLVEKGIMPSAIYNIENNKPATKEEYQRAQDIISQFYKRLTGKSITQDKSGGSKRSLRYENDKRTVKGLLRQYGITLGKEIDLSDPKQLERLISRLKKSDFLTYIDKELLDAVFDSAPKIMFVDNAELPISLNEDGVFVIDVRYAGSDYKNAAVNFETLVLSALTQAKLNEGLEENEDLKSEVENLMQQARDAFSKKYPNLDVDKISMLNNVSEFLSESLNNTAFQSFLGGVTDTVSGNKESLWKSMMAKIMKAFKKTFDKSVLQRAVSLANMALDESITDSIDVKADETTESEVEEKPEPVSSVEKKGYKLMEVMPGVWQVTGNNEVKAFDTKEEAEAYFNEKTKPGKKTVKQTVKEKVKREIQLGNTEFLENANERPDLFGEFLHPEVVSNNNLAVAEWTQKIVDLGKELDDARITNWVYGNVRAQVDGRLVIDVTAEVPVFVKKALKNKKANPRVAQLQKEISDLDKKIQDLNAKRKTTPAKSTTDTNSIRNDVAGLKTMFDSQYLTPVKSTFNYEARQELEAEAKKNKPLFGKVKTVTREEVEKRGFENFVKAIQSTKDTTNTTELNYTIFDGLGGWLIKNKSANATNDLINSDSHPDFRHEYTGKRNQNWAEYDEGFSVEGKRVVNIKVPVRTDEDTNRPSVYFSFTLELPEGFTAESVANPIIEKLKQFGGKASTKELIPIVTQQAKEIIQKGPKAGVKVTLAQMPVVEDSVNTEKVMGKAIYIPMSVYEEAYANDTANNTQNGQPLAQIIARGGYSVRELDDLLPDWKERVYAINNPGQSQTEENVNEDVDREINATLKQRNALQDQLNAEDQDIIEEGEETVQQGTKQVKFLMYKSTGTGSTALSLGEWVPLLAIGTHPDGREWFVKAYHQGVDPKFNKYGSSTFDSIDKDLKANEANLFTGIRRTEEIEEEIEREIDVEVDEDVVDEEQTIEQPANNNEDELKNLINQKRELLKRVNEQIASARKIDFRKKIKLDKQKTQLLLDLKDLQAEYDAKYGSEEVIVTDETPGVEIESEEIVDLDNKVVVTERTPYPSLPVELQNQLLDQYRLLLGANAVGAVRSKYKAEIKQLEALNRSMAQASEEEVDALDEKFGEVFDALVAAVGPGFTIRLNEQSKIEIGTIKSSDYASDAEIAQIEKLMKSDMSFMRTIIDYNKSIEPELTVELTEEQIAANNAEQIEIGKQLKQQRLDQQREEARARRKARRQSIVPINAMEREQVSELLQKVLKDDFDILTKADLSYLIDNLLNDSKTFRFKIPDAIAFVNKKKMNLEEQSQIQLVNETFADELEGLEPKERAAAVLGYQKDIFEEMSENSAVYNYGILSKYIKSKEPIKVSYNGKKYSFTLTPTDLKALAVYNKKLFDKPLKTKEDEESFLISVHQIMENVKYYAKDYKKNLRFTGTQEEIEDAAVKLFFKLKKQGILLPAVVRAVNYALYDSKAKLTIARSNALSGSIYTLEARESLARKAQPKNKLAQDKSLIAFYVYDSGAQVTSELWQEAAVALWLSKPKNRVNPEFITKNIARGKSEIRFYKSFISNTSQYKTADGIGDAATQDFMFDIKEADVYMQEAVNEIFSNYKSISEMVTAIANRIRSGQEEDYDAEYESEADFQKWLASSESEKASEDFDEYINSIEFKIETGQINLATLDYASLTPSQQLLFDQAVEDGLYNVTDAEAANDVANQEVEMPEEATASTDEFLEYLNELEAKRTAVDIREAELLEELRKMGDAYPFVAFLISQNEALENDKDLKLFLASYRIANADMFNPFNSKQKTYVNDRLMKRLDKGAFIGMSVLINDAPMQIYSYNLNDKTVDLLDINTGEVQTLPLDELFKTTDVFEEGQEYTKLNLDTVVNDQEIAYIKEAYQDIFNNFTASVAEFEKLDNANLNSKVLEQLTKCK